MVFIGGGLGSLLRFGIGRLSINLFSGNLPIGTFVANLFSCLILGVVLGSFKSQFDKNSALYFLLAVGLCGGLSTFSTFSYESLKLFQEGLYIAGILNIIVSVSLCMAILWFVLR